MTLQVNVQDLHVNKAMLWPLLEYVVNVLINVKIVKQILQHVKMGVSITQEIVLKTVNVKMENIVV